MGRKKKTHDKFCEEVFNLVGNEYVVLEEYSGSNIKILIKHNICRYEYMERPDLFLGGKRCPYCESIKTGKPLQKGNNIRKCTRKRERTKYIPKGINGMRKRRKSDDFKKEVAEKTNNEYVVLDNFINIKTKIRFKHNINECGEIFEMEPNWFLKSSKKIKCPVCSSKSYRKNHEQFCQEVYDLVGDEYTVLGKYKDSRTKISLRHNYCGHEYKIKGYDFTIRGRRCPLCKESKGEQRIRHFLENNNISHDSQFIFNDLKYIDFLRFDFVVFDNNSRQNISALIEYDGEQHFEWIKGWISKKDFKTQQIRDKMKDKYCLKHNIHLIRIPYWEFDNIETILSKELNTLCKAS